MSDSFFPGTSQELHDLVVSGQLPLPLDLLFDMDRWCVEGHTVSEERAARDIFSHAVWVAMKAGRVVKFGPVGENNNSVGAYILDTNRPFDKWVEHIASTPLHALAAIWPKLGIKEPPQ